ncbi:MAG: stage V sporulation protein AA [Thermobacillus sp. ZCTH02-B1]|uniref:stage V sporulation protein AA n=1 Tax=Thermobacillus sp. ZCTH02-B1 TaxID=1858795 RepID=UPI000B55A0E1|nr:stage V sporulation protein AA [Thermobacillus sp. ZCTH02-B1]OUM96832.1 MAG: stage V sporulation protein AA [Thermobacillus sp. ZCTH02-B1]
MTTVRTNTLYVRLRKRLVIRPGDTVRLGDVARLLADDERERRLAGLVLYRHSPEDGDRAVIDMLHVIRAVSEAEPGLDVEFVGEPQTLVTVTARSQKPIPGMLVVAWLLLFFGSGLTIMNFHADVGMLEVHRRMTELITGTRAERPLWFQIPYSIGVGLGMILFFNRVIRRKLSEEPSPLEVEMYQYQENVDAYVVADEMRKLHGGGGVSRGNGGRG